jgi:hypothetical protein
VFWQSGSSPVVSGTLGVRKGGDMYDLIYVAMLVGFFGVSEAYIRFAARL